MFSFPATGEAATFAEHSALETRGSWACWSLWYEPPGCLTLPHPGEKINNDLELERAVTLSLFDAVRRCLLSEGLPSP